jgi:hypothetical protein
MEIFTMCKHFLTILIAGLTFCGWASAATVTVNRYIANTLSTLSPAGTTQKIESTIRTSHFMPEVYVGNGTRPPGVVQTDAEDSALDDDTLQDSTKE